VHAVRLPVSGLYRAVIPRLSARTPVRRGMECDFRDSAAAVVLLSGLFLGSWAKRSGRGAFVDLIARKGVMERRLARIEEGSRNGGGSKPQLSGGLGGMVVGG